MLRPKYQELRKALLLGWYECDEDFVLPKERVAVTAMRNKEVAAAFGWPVVADHSIRVDILSKVERFLRDAPKRKEVPNTPMQWLGCKEKEWHAIVKALGYRIHEGLLLAPKKRRR